MPYSNCVLLVEGDPAVETRVRDALQGLVRIHTVTSTQGALDEMSKGPYPIVLVAGDLPGGDGIGLCATIRDLPHGHQAVIMVLGSKRGMAEKLRSYDLGADDYILKPFNPLELRARISGKMKSLQRHANPKMDIVKGPFAVHLGQQRLTILTGGSENVPVNLTTNQFKILLYLIRNEEKPVSRQEILHEIWGKDAQISGRTIDTHMHAIRQQLGEYAKYVQSIHGKGYCFTVRRVFEGAS